MTADTVSQHTSDSSLLDGTKLQALAREIAEVMFDWQETSTMERNVDARLLEQVSRILHRCEERPDQLREAEDALMHMDDPDLGIALLRQFFLVKSEHNEQSVIRQLVRLARSQARKTFDLTQDALREAAYSETPRLQNIGCQALFQSDLLSDAELREFTRSEEIGFQHRIAAVELLVKRQSALAPAALVDVIIAWGALPEDDQRKFEKPLIEVTHSFDNYATLDDDFIERILDELFCEVDRRGLSPRQKHFLQRAMAALPERTIEYIQSLGSEHLGSPAVIFTLGTCANRSVLATEALLTHARQLLDSTARQRSRSLVWIATRLKRARHDHDVGVHKALEELIEAVQYDGSLTDVSKIVAHLQMVQESWQGSTLRRDLAVLLKSLAADFEVDQVLDDRDSWELRHAFETGRKPTSASRLGKTERAVLAEAMIQTAETRPWESSASWLQKNYEAFEGYQRIVIQDTMGYVALREQGVVETKRFRSIRGFFEQLVQGGSPAEKQHAGEWLDRLVGEKLPGTGRV